MPININSKSFRVAELTWPDVEQAAQLGAMAVLPIAAGAKEHGWHLPMNTDAQQADWLVEQLLDQPGLLIWPVVNYGYYPAFVEFPGSVSTTETTFSALVNQICNSIFLSGIQKLALLNTGISTVRPLKNVAANSNQNIRLINVYSGTHFNIAVEKHIEQSTGGHADEVETSIMLAINGKQVDMTKASGSATACSQPGVLRRHDSSSPNYTPSGACGEPQRASIEKGIILLKAMILDINEQLLALKSV